ncbi:hypothetical protein FRC03_006860 [Tulasnella sp. 419]|nr:hypothetical protein FRC03_006860 [Tulasnella sp. 419]
MANPNPSITARISAVLLNRRNPRYPSWMLRLLASLPIRKVVRLRVEEDPKGQLATGRRLGRPEEMLRQYLKKRHIPLINPSATQNLQSREQYPPIP